MKKRWIGFSALGLAGAVLAGRRRAQRRAPRAWTLDLPEGAIPEAPDQGSIQFIGTATTIIRYEGFTILTDPNFLHRGEQVHLGYGIHSTRLTDPAVNLEDLPAIDFVLLSHLHEDHFDKLVEARLDRSIPILTTASAARSLARKGFHRTFPLHTWDSVDIRKGASRLRMTAMPGTHGPLAVSALLPSVIGSMLEFDGRAGARNLRLYITGDTLVHDQLREIPRRFPNVDIALLHLGGTRILGILVTMNGKQGVQTLRIIGPKLAIPIHFNDYTVFKSPLREFADAVARAKLQDRVRYLNHGDTFHFALDEVRGIREAEIAQPERGRGFGGV